MPVNEEKYIVFKRSDFEKTILPNLENRYRGLEIDDAVVIRRQDRFASPCLLTYAAMIALVAENHPSRGIAEDLLAIADYFHHQGVLAAEEGRKLPTL